MNAMHLELLQRLNQFQLDAPEAVYPFSARLARENNWPSGYAQRVIAEYKRFAYLAIAAGHPVSPSEDVDQAWHLHLTYTESYWKQFCGEVLRKPLHHHPTRGGTTEQAKFQDWYARTLESYEAHFNEPAPLDIWPRPHPGAIEHPHFMRIDSKRHWIIPKPGPRFLRRFFASAALVLIAVGCTGAMMAYGAGPFDWRGREFLRFYAVLIVCCFGLASWLRWKLRVPAPQQTSSAPLDIEPYAMAFLNGGSVLATNTAIANLARRGLLKVDQKRIRGSGTVTEADHPLEQTIHTIANTPAGATIAATRDAIRPIAEELADDLKKRGLIMTDPPARKARWWPFLIAALVPVVGAIKIGIGLSREKPVAILSILVLATAALALLGFLRRPFRSRLGDAVLNQLQITYSKMSSRVRRDAGMSSMEFATAIGLFGLVALEGTALADLQKSLKPPQVGGDSGGCGGGGSCGGGGCGGGCGGCGGS